MGEYNEALVAFDPAKMKPAVAVAEGGRGGEGEQLFSFLLRHGRCSRAG